MFVVALAALSASAKEIWQDPTVFEKNRLPSRAIVVPCESADKALAVAKGARHQWDLVAEDEITVNVDARQMGVGGDNSWGCRPHDDDMLGKGEYRLSFLIEGI